jgi:hypothetical protein
MSFFTRTVIGLALVAGVVHVFRKDLAKIGRVLQKPAENFVKEVKKELDADTGKKAAAVLGDGAQAAGGVSAADAARQQAAEIGDAAAAAVRASEAAQPPPPSSAASVEPPTEKKGAPLQ